MTPWVRRLLFANVAVYLAMALGVIAPQLVNQLVLVPALVPFRPWTVITYQFLHAGTLHLLFNMIGLFFFGPRLEARLGSRHFLGLYLGSGIAGAILSVFTPNVAIVGASGAVFGILLGFARYWPAERIYIWGVLPVPARILVIGLAIISIWLGIAGAGNVAHFAHLGGFVGGWIYLVILERNSPAKKFKQKVEAVAPARPGARDLERWKKVDRSSLHPLNRDEFDRVLEKARAMGPLSLSEQERGFMERFTKK
jgi:membrane associated rhomboid family serine protease